MTERQGVGPGDNPARGDDDGQCSEADGAPRRLRHAIHVIREENDGIEQQEIARRIGVAPAELSARKSCKKAGVSITWAFAHKLQDGFGIDAVWLMTGKGTMRPMESADSPPYSVEVDGPTICGTEVVSFVVWHCPACIGVLPHFGAVRCRCGHKLTWKNATRGAPKGAHQSV